MEGMPTGVPFKPLGKYGKRKQTQILKAKIQIQMHRKSDMSFTDTMFLDDVRLLFMSTTNDFVIICCINITIKKK